MTCVLALSPRPVPHLSPAQLPQVAFRGFLFCGVDARTLTIARQVDAADLKQDARCLWGSAQALGLIEQLRAERADQVRQQGGLLS